MNKLSDLIFPFDLVRLSREKLVEIASQFGIETNASIVNLADNIWNVVRNNSDKREQMLHIIKEVIFLGRTCVTWYTLSEEQKNLNIESAFKEKLGKKIFEEVNVFDISNDRITTDIIGGFKVSEKKYVVRLIVKMGINKVPVGAEILTQASSIIATVIIDMEKGYIEIRCDSKATNKVISKIGHIFDTKASKGIERYSIQYYAQNIEKFAELLNGNLIEINAMPDKLFKELSEEQIKAIIKALASLDNFFNDGDANKFLAEIQSCKAVFDEDDEFDGTPFSAIVLAGMDKLGLSVDKESDSDLKNHPLFASWNPYLQHQNGFVRFNVNEDGVKRQHTVRIGLTTDSISFRTYATETALNYLREKLLFKEL